MRKGIHISFDSAAPAPRSSLRVLPASAPRPARPGDRLGDLAPGADINPAASYLATLAPSGRRSMRARLDRAASLLRPGSDAGAFPWSKLKFDHVQYLRTRLLMEGASDQTVNLTLVALRQTALSARRLGQLSSDDCDGVLSVKGVRREASPRGRMLSTAEKARLFRACARDRTARGPRDAALLTLLAGAGLRREEAARLRLDDFDAGGRTLRLRGKGNREDRLPLPPEVAAAVSDWLGERGRKPGPLLAPVSRTGRVMAGRGLTAQAVYLVVKRLAAAAGCEPLTPHDLRRTYISELLDGEDASTVRALARHANIATTVRYDRRGERAKAKAIKLLTLPYKRPRPKRAPKKAKRKRGRRRVNKAL